MSKFSEVRVGQKFAWPTNCTTQVGLFVRMRETISGDFRWNAVRISGDCSGVPSEFMDDEKVLILQN